MSDEIPDRSEILRSTIITTVFTALFIALSVIFWWWSTLEGTTPLTELNNINNFMAPILEVAFMGFSFFFLTVTVVNLQLYLTQMRAGWMEIIILLAAITIMSYFMFGLEVTAASFAICLAFIAYIYLIQD